MIGMESASPVPSILAIILSVALALGLIAGGAGLPPADSVSLDYTYSASYHALGQTGNLSADFSLSKGRPAFHFSGGDATLSLQDGALDLSSLGLSAEDTALLSQFAAYAFDGRLQRDLDALRPYLNGLFCCNAFSMDMQPVSWEDSDAVHQYTIDTTPQRLLGAMQRWMMILGADPDLKAALDALEICRLPAVQQALAAENNTLGTIAADSLLSAGASLSASLCGSMYEADAMKTRIHAVGIVGAAGLRSGLLQIGDPDEKDTGFRLEAHYQSDEGTATGDLTLLSAGKTLVSAAMKWQEHPGAFSAHGSWLIPSGGSDYDGGDFSFEFALGRHRELSRLDMNVSVYGTGSSPTLSLTYQNNQISFLYIQNPSYYSVSSVSSLPPFLRAVFSWDDNAYTLYARGSQLEVQGGGTYERTGDGFRQKGEAQVRTWPRYGGETTSISIRVEQDFTFGPHNFRLTQHAEAGLEGVPVLTYDDRHALTLR